MANMTRAQWRNEYTVDTRKLFTNGSLVSMKADYLSVLEKYPECGEETIDALYDMLCQGRMMAEVTAVLLYASNAHQCDEATDAHYELVREEAMTSQKAAQANYAHAMTTYGSERK